MHPRSLSFVCSRYPIFPPTHDHIVWHDVMLGVVSLLLGLFSWLQEIRSVLDVHEEFTSGGTPPLRRGRRGA